MNLACTLQNMEIIDEELDEPVGPTLRSLSQKRSVGDPVAETILAKKVTRKQTYYQVITILSVLGLNKLLQKVYSKLCSYF